jgi:hypothetical protein
LFHDNAILCHFYFRNEKKLTVINGKGLDSDYDKLNIKVRAEMGHGLEVEMVTGNRACNG